MQKLQALQLKFVWHSSAAERPKKKNSVNTQNVLKGPVTCLKCCLHVHKQTLCHFFLTRESPAHLTQIMFTYTTWCIFNTEDFIVYAFFISSEFLHSLVASTHFTDHSKWGRKKK